PSSATTYDANDRALDETYDANGNVTIVGGTQNRFDFEDHLVARGNVNLVYDGDGQRVAKTVNGVTTWYLVDELAPTGFGHVAEEIAGGAVVKSYVYGHQLIAQKSAAGTHYYGYDGTRSVRFLTDAAGSITDTYDYDAFGNLLRATGSTPNAYRYRGEELDADLGAYYLRARYYDANSGRFWSTDPELGGALDPMSLHRYLYANANPVSNSDPTGRFSMAEVGATLEVMGIMIAQNWARKALIGGIFGAVGGGVEAYLSGGDVGWGIFGGAVLGAILGPLASGPMAFRIGRIIMSVASVGVGGWSAIRAYNNKQWGLALFYTVTCVGGAVFSAFTYARTMAPFRAPGGRVAVWQGGAAARIPAEQWATGAGTRTLGQTPGGAAIEAYIARNNVAWEHARPLWVVASREYVGQAREVRAFIRVPSDPTSIYRTDEVNVLMQRYMGGYISIWETNLIY
ncbi:MAG TPA: RHS repeat-associated core domain-containing protein, partial [Thermoanaerobaculia bacterium]